MAFCEGYTKPSQLSSAFKGVYEGFGVVVRYLRLLGFRHGESAVWLSLKGVYKAEYLVASVLKGYTMALESLSAIFGLLAIGMESLPLGFL